MKFNSQTCTSREQSKRLLALGLKKETADMHYSTDQRGNVRQLWLLAYGDLHEDVQVHSLPAWSLHRLIEMIGDMFEMQHWLGFNIEKDYDHTIDCIEWLINKELFNKEYLQEQAGSSREG